MRRFLFGGSVLAAAAATSLAAAMPMDMPGKAAVQGWEDQFAAKGNAGDAAGMAQMYAPDAIVMPPGAPRLDGRAAAQAYWTEALKAVGDVKLTTTEVWPLGHDAVEEIGTFSLKTKEAAPKSLAGKYVVIWRMSEGGWKLSTDIWNDGP